MSYQATNTVNQFVTSHLAHNLDLLAELYPNSKTELYYTDPFQLLIAVILSAQCTDARVNQVTPVLFKQFPTALKLAKAKPPVVEKIIHSCGFFKAKTKSIIKCAQSIVDHFDGNVPKSLDELVTLAGVGRKTASVVLNQAWGIPAIAVDTHVMRVSYRLGWTQNTDPVKIETDLKTLLPESQWAHVNGRLILHGRRVCDARKPKCEQCSLEDTCDFAKHSKGKPADNPTRKTRAKLSRTQ